MTVLSVLFSTALAQTYLGSGQPLSYDDLRVEPEFEHFFVTEEPDPDAVVGGTVVNAGDWDDTVGIVFQRSYVGCTGTLIAPKVVLTAEHCLGGITHVVVGSKNWYTDQGEVVEVRRSIGHPRADIAVLLLEEASSYTPRTMALDCIADDYIVDGAEVAVVGFGAIDERGRQNTSKLHEGYTYVQDADCDETYIDGYYSGCDRRLSPGGEIGAGGNGVDACFGDSGGPLYLLTEKGDFLVGVTSRAYSGAPSNAPCRVGGIYVRPDSVINWIQNQSGEQMARPQCNAAPAPIVETLYTKKNTAGSTLVDPNDADAENTHTFAIATDPAYGAAEVDDAGVVTYTPEKGFTGTDSLVVAVTDDGSIYEASGPITTEVTVDVQVGGSAGLNGERVGPGCGCNGGAAGTSWALLPLLALFLRRR